MQVPGRDGRAGLEVAGSKTGDSWMEIALYGSIAWRHPFGFGQAIHWARRFGWGCVDARGLSIGVPGDMERNLNAFGYDMLGPRQIRKSARGDLRRQLEDAPRMRHHVWSLADFSLQHIRK